MLRFVVDTAPVAWARPRYNSSSRRFFESPRVRRYRRYVALLARKAWAGKRPLSGPVALTLRFYIGGRAACRKPDLSNLVKVIEDALVDAGVMEDDAQIVHIQACKWANTPRGTEVEIEVLG